MRVKILEPCRKYEYDSTIHYVFILVLMDFHLPHWHGSQRFYMVFYNVLHDVIWFYMVLRSILETILTSNEIEKTFNTIWVGFHFPLLVSPFWGEQQSPGAVIVGASQGKCCAKKGFTSGCSPDGPSRQAQLSSLQNSSDIPLVGQERDSPWIVIIPDIFFQKRYAAHIEPHVHSSAPQAGYLLQFRGKPKPSFLVFCNW